MRGEKKLNLSLEPGVCDICNQHKEHTVQGCKEMIRVCSDCGRLDTIGNRNNRRIRSTKEEIAERSRRVNNSAWMSRLSG